MMFDVQRVLDEHRALDVRAAGLESALYSGQRIEGAIFKQIAAYANLLSEHLLGEHQVLGEAFERRSPPNFGAKTFSLDLEALRWDWEEYLSVWSQESPAKDWSMFVEHSLALLARIRRRIAREMSFCWAPFQRAKSARPPGPAPAEPI